MTRFILCSFALVLLYPTAIDLYLVGLPQVARDLGANGKGLIARFGLEEAANPIDSQRVRADEQEHDKRRKLEVC